ncbi:protein CNPPD1 [Drosophila tropicalis]|uniref:protein CNPPD1 n=1 Tax=Drosophila tropicalis TaxID=46794 RepID=UPI0035ABC2EC
MGRSKFVPNPNKKVMHHGEYINRIRKTLYYGMNLDMDTDSDSDMALSLPFAEYAAEIFSEPHRGHSLHRLNCVTAGKFQATPCSLIMALIYLDRLNIIDPGYCCRITPQELFVLSLMISTKFYAGHDERFYLEDWAKEGNMTEDRLKEMELEFLTAIDWNIYISNEQFFEKLNTVERTLAERQGLRRGWLTYSELVQLLPDFAWMKFMLNNIAVLALSYAASVITIAGAFFIASQVPGTLWYRTARTTATRNETMANSNATSTMTVTTPVDSTNATQAAPVIINHEITSDPSDANESCLRLNVEEELTKLEQQYCDEARLSERERIRRLEKPAPNHPLFPADFGKTAIFTHRDNAQNWLNIKSQYSDVGGGLEHQNPFPLGQYNNHHLQQHNASVFWQLLSDAMQNSFIIRWPELWPKLI